MNLLLDTHVFLWLAGGERMITESARAYLQDPRNTVYFSAVSAWEIAIKRSLGKLEAPANLSEAVSRFGFQELPITVEHALAVELLPHHHNDPFDRLLIAQAVTTGLHLVTRDSAIVAYDVPVIPA